MSTHLSSLPVKSSIEELENEIKRLEGNDDKNVAEVIESTGTSLAKLSNDEDTTAPHDRTQIQTLDQKQDQKQIQTLNHKQNNNQSNLRDNRDVIDMDQHRAYNYMESKLYGDEIKNYNGEMVPLGKPTLPTNSSAHKIITDFKLHEHSKLSKASPPPPVVEAIKTPGIVSQGELYILVQLILVCILLSHVDIVLRVPATLVTPSLNSKCTILKFVHQYFNTISIHIKIISTHSQNPDYLN